jgi:hypothetical protein
MLLRTHDFDSSTELTMHPQGSGGNSGLGSLGLDGDGDDTAPSRRRAWFCTGRRVENSRVARHVALGVLDVLLPHHVLGTCQKIETKVSNLQM